MACYIGAIETTADTVSFSTPLETPWDDGTGTSALTELCRMVNDRLVALHQTAHTFTSVGSTAADGAFVARAYASNPSRHPIYEFANVLSECKAQVYLMISPQTTTPVWFGGMVNSSGYRWRYNNAATVKATLDGALSGLLATLVEDWKPMIVALRAALVSLSGAQIQSQPWTATTLSFASTALIAGVDPASPSDLVYKSSGVDLSTINYYSVTKALWAPVVSPDNEWPQTFLNEYSFDLEDEDHQFYFGFNAPEGSVDPAPTSTTTSILVGRLGALDPPWTTSDTDEVYGGWYKKPESATYYFRFKASSPTGAANLVGKTLDFAVELYDNNGLTVNCTPSSGTLTFTTLSQVTTGKALAVAASIPDSAMADGASPAEFCEQAYSGGAYGVPLRCNMRIALSNNSYPFCIDSNGKYHDD